MPPADTLRRKLTIRARGRTLVLVKRAGESGEHVVQKAVLWARHLGDHPDLRVEQPLPFPSRWKPDLHALDDTGRAVAFWGECGVVSAAKLADLLRRHPATHFVFSKWAARLDRFAAQIDEAIAGARRRAPVELVGIPAEASDWLVDGRELVVHETALDVRRWEPGR